jgi:hypothetical protein
MWRVAPLPPCLQSADCIGFLRAINPTFAKDVLSNVEAEPNYLQRWIFNEAAFHISGSVNHHNCRIWRSENPHVIHEIKRQCKR